MISCMTGGTHQGRDANRDLAIAAQACGVAVGLGSMRVGLENPDVLDHFAVKDGGARRTGGRQLGRGATP